MRWAEKKARNINPIQDNNERNRRKPLYFLLCDERVEAAAWYVVLDCWVFIGASQKYCREAYAFWILIEKLWSLILANKQERTSYTRSSDRYSEESCSLSLRVLQTCGGYSFKLFRCVRSWQNNWVARNTLFNALQQRSGRFLAQALLPLTSGV